jgi:hypothetical protein
MKRIAPLAVVALAACPSNPPSGNPDVLWLAPFMSETRVQLVDSEPPPY